MIAVTLLASSSGFEGSTAVATLIDFTDMCERWDPEFVIIASEGHTEESFDLEMMAKRFLEQWLQTSEEQPLGWLGGLEGGLRWVTDQSSYGPSYFVA
jgi:hypothetical protein